MRRINLIIELFLFVMTSIAQQNVVRGPYLQELTDTSVVVCWRTDQASDSRVYFSQTLGLQTNYVDSFGQYIDHKVKISGLTPSSGRLS